MLSWNQNQFLTVTVCFVKSVMQELCIVYTVTQVFFHYKLQIFMFGCRLKSAVRWFPCNDILLSKQSI